jgi:hypothetical protein
MCTSRWWASALSMSLAAVSQCVSGDAVAPTKLEIDRSDIELEVSAMFQEPELSSFTFFRSRHTPAQKEVLGIDFLYSRPALEQQALLTLYEPVASTKGAKAVEPAQQRWERGEDPRSDDEQLQFVALARDAAITPRIALTTAVEHYQAAIDHAEALAARLQRDPTPRWASRHCAS